jgi:hypothetical protein
MFGIEEAFVTKSAPSPARTIRLHHHHKSEQSKQPLQQKGLQYLRYAKLKQQQFKERHPQTLHSK